MKNNGTSTAENSGEIVKVRRRQDRSILTRATIIAAATLAFAEAGFNGATTRSIAARAGVQHALVIHHFHSKIGLWKAVMHDVLGVFAKAFSERLDSLSDEDDATKLRLLQADFIRLAANRPELHWLMSDEAGKPGERLDWLVENHVGRAEGNFIELIKSAQRTGQYVEGDPHHLHYLFLGAVSRVFMLSGEFQKVCGRSPFDADFVEEHIETIRKLFFRKA